MKLSDITAKGTAMMSMVGFKVKKHSPEILLIAGVTGLVATVVVACKATTKAPEILEKSHEEIEKIHETAEAQMAEVEENVEPADDLVADIKKCEAKELTVSYSKTAIAFAKLYGPSFILGAASVACILSSHGLMKKRNAVLSAAYVAVDKSFKEYRNRVVDRFGEEVDQELKYNIQKMNVKETIVDENGEVHEVDKTINYADRKSVGEYATFFEQWPMNSRSVQVKNYNWNDNADANIAFLRCQLNYLNNLLQSRYSKYTGPGIVFLNEVLESLGLPITKAGQSVGWIYDPANGKNSHISFGFANFHDMERVVYGDNDAILLDFNVDGLVADYL